MHTAYHFASHLEQLPHKISLKSESMQVVGGRWMNKEIKDGRREEKENDRQTARFVVNDDVEIFYHRA